jgi:hypothetical protein
MIDSIGEYLLIGGAVNQHLHDHYPGVLPLPVNAT